MVYKKIESRFLYKFDSRFTHFKSEIIEYFGELD